MFCLLCGWNSAYISAICTLLWRAINWSIPKAKWHAYPIQLSGDHMTVLREYGGGLTRQSKILFPVKSCGYMHLFLPVQARSLFCFGSWESACFFHWGNSEQFPTLIARHPQAIKIVLSSEHTTMFRWK